MEGSIRSWCDSYLLRIIKGNPHTALISLTCALKLCHISQDLADDTGNGRPCSAETARDEGRRLSFCPTKQRV